MAESALGIQPNTDYDRNGHKFRYSVIDGTPSDINIKRCSN